MLRAVLITAVFLTFALQTAAQRCAPGSIADNAPEIRFSLATPVSGAIALEAREMRNGYILWMEWVNQEHGGISVAGVCHRAVLVVHDITDEQNFDIASVERLIFEDRADFVFAPYSPTLSYTTATIGDRANLIVMESGGAGESLFTHGFQNLFGLVTPDAAYTAESLEEVFQLGARTAVIAYNHDMLSHAQSARDILDRLGMRTLAVDAIPEGDLSSLFTRFRELNPDVFISVGYSGDNHRLIQQARAMAFNAPAFLVTHLPAMNTYAEYLWGVVQWRPDSRFADDEFGTAADYSERYKARFGGEPGSEAAEATATALSLHLAIESASSLETEVVRAALLDLKVDTFFGTVDFDENGVSLNPPMTTVQVQMGEPVPITPQNTIWPMPTWEERGTEPVFATHG